MKKLLLAVLALSSVSALAFTPEMLKRDVAKQEQEKGGDYQTPATDFITHTCNKG